MTAFESLEVWLSSRVGALQKTFSKVLLGFGTLVLPLFLLWSGLSTANKILAYTLWVSMIGNLLLAAVVCRYRVVQRQRASVPTKPQADIDPISDLEFSLLSKMFDYYPERYTHKELAAASGCSQVDVDHALMLMLRRSPKLIHKPSGGLHRMGDPNPRGLGITADGMTLVKKISEQAETRNRHQPPCRRS